MAAIVVLFTRKIYTFNIKYSNISNGDFQGKDPTWDLSVFKTKTLILFPGMLLLFAIETWLVDFNNCPGIISESKDASFIKFVVPFIFGTYFMVLLSKLFAYFNDYVRYKIEYYEKYIDKILLNFCLFYLSIAYIFALYHWIFFC